MALFWLRNPFFIHWLCYFLPVFSRLYSYLNIFALWCAGRCFPSFKVDLLLFCCQRRRVVKESQPQVSHWLLHGDLFACWESVFASVLTRLCIFHCRATFQSQFSLAASPRFSGFSPRPPPATSPHKPSGSFLRKKSDVCRCRSTWSLEINATQEAGAARRYPEDCLSFIAHISLRCQAGRR